MKPKLLAAGAFATLVVLVLPARASDVGTIHETLVGGKSHAILLIAAKEAGETAKLTGTTKYTLFAPTDAAFKALDDPAIDDLAADTNAVQRLVRMHLVEKEYTADDLRNLARDGKELKTVGGVALKVEDGKDGLRVGGVKVTASIPCRNGVVHITDAVVKR